MLHDHSARTKTRTPPQAGTSFNQSSKLHNHCAGTRTRTGRALVAAAVSAAIIGAVAIGEPWNPANAAAGTSADAGTSIGAASRWPRSMAASPTS